MSYLRTFPNLAKSRFAILIAAVTASMPLVATAQQGGQRPPQPVTVVTLEAQDITLTSTLPGRVVASGTAEVRPQVDGIIVEQLFEEGAEVKIGDPLFKLDDALYAAQVARANAAVAQSHAALVVAQKEADRMASLVAKTVASQQNLDDAIGVRDAAAAGLLVAKADLQTAQINLDRTTIRATLSGVVGRTLTTKGALVTTGQTAPLAVIRKIDPVYLDVTAAAAEIVKWRRNDHGPLVENIARNVTLKLADGENYAETGELTATEPYVDPLTGVSVLRMTFPNPDRLLLPGMYAQVDLPVGIADSVVLVPQEGVTFNRKGEATALVVNAKNIVEPRVITLLGDRGNKWIAGSGLVSGDRVIVAGLQKIAPGATVAPQERAPANTADAQTPAPAS